MDNSEDEGDDIVEVLTQLRGEMKKIQGKVTVLERYLRDEGYGDDYDEDEGDEY